MVQLSLAWLLADSRDHVRHSQTTNECRAHSLQCPSKHPNLASTVVSSRLKPFQPSPPPLPPKTHRPNLTNGGQLLVEVEAKGSVLLDCCYVHAAAKADQQEQPRQLREGRWAGRAGFSKSAAQVSAPAEKRAAASCAQSFQTAGASGDEDKA